MKDYKALYEESQKALKASLKKVSKLEKQNATLQSINADRMAKKQAVIDTLRSDLKKKDARKKGLAKEQSALLSSLLNGTHTQDL